jgi:hypothetical protein
VSWQSGFSSRARRREVDRAFEFDVPAGAKVPIPHSHDAYEGTLYGLEGVLTRTIDDEAAGGPPDPAAIGAVMRRHGPTPAP